MQENVYSKSKVSKFSALAILSRVATINYIKNWLIQELIKCLGADLICEANYPVTPDWGAREEMALCPLFCCSGVVLKKEKKTCTSQNWHCNVNDNQFFSLFCLYINHHPSTEDAGRFQQTWYRKCFCEPCDHWIIEIWMLVRRITKSIIFIIASSGVWQYFAFQRDDIEQK